MKNVILILIVLLVTNCKSDSKSENTDSAIETLEKKKQKMIDKASKKNELLDCKDYFKKADYSSVCFTNDKTPTYTIVSSTDLGCVFRFAKSENFDEYFDVNLTTYKNQKDADGMYNIVLMEMSDDLETITNLGDSSSLEKTDKVDSNRSLYIKYNNSFIQIKASRVVGTRPTPCFYSKEEMIKFAKLLLSEL